jgi:hypothetical protein
MRAHCDECKDWTVGVFGGPSNLEDPHDSHGGAAGSFASEGCAQCAALDDEDGDPDPPQPDPDALYDAAVDDAMERAIEDGRPISDWMAYMRGGRA